MSISPEYLKVASLQALRSQADTKHAHARACKEPACKVCSANRLWFDSLPPGALALVLEDRPTAKG